MQGKLDPRRPAGGRPRLERVLRIGGVGSRDEEGRGQAGEAANHSTQVRYRVGGDDDSSDGDQADDRDRVAGTARTHLGVSAFDPGRPGLRALAAVAVLVVLGAALLAWWSRPRPEPVTAQVTTAAAAVPTNSTPTPPADLVVAVTGLVHEPGLVTLPPGARVADAVAAAGGPLPEAELGYLNLARKVTDGELVAVGIPPPPGGPGNQAGGAGGPAGGRVDLNTATLGQLQTLPGIGPALGQRIIDYRAEHGRFRSVGELRQVSGIGEVRFAELKDLVTV